MQRFLRSELEPLLRAEGKQRGLYEALQSRDYLRLDFDAAQTRTAAQAFQDRSGNCLSLVILSAALGRQLGLMVTFQQVIGEDSWGLSGDMVVASGHVNLVLGQRNVAAFGDDSQSLTVDFLPTEAVRGRRSRIIQEAQVVAMFQNNRAVENLAQGRLDDAYAWAKAALLGQPAMTAAWNTLGVIYQRRGLPEFAERAYLRALADDPQEVRTLSNLAGLLREQQREEEAQAISRRVADLQPDPPFHHFRLGLAAAKAGDWAQAQEHLEKELRRDPEFQDAQAWLAQTYLALGDASRAELHLALAAKHASTAGSRAAYSAKLEHLQAAVRAESGLRTQTQ
jgi:Tfp pilus assembly protein PilF